MGQNGYDNSSPYYYGNKSYYGNLTQKTPNNSYQSQTPTTKDFEQSNSVYQASNNHAPAAQTQAPSYPSHMEYSQRQTSHQGRGLYQNHGSYQNQGSSSYSERDSGQQPCQPSHSTVDTSALRHLAHTSTLQGNTVPTTASDRGQGTGSLHQVIDYNRSQTPVSATQSNAVRRLEPPGEQRSQMLTDSHMTQNRGGHTMDGNLYGAGPLARFPEQPSQAKAPQMQLDRRGSGQQSSIYRPPSTNVNRGSGAVNQPSQPPIQKTKPPASSGRPLTTDPIIRDVPQSPAPPHQPLNSAAAAQDSYDESTNPQHPLTVNPSQVFNQEEYALQRARSKAEASNASRQATSAGKGDGDDGRKEQIEADMKAMIRKMQEYKSKDPGLFSQIWEQVKTGQAPTRASPQVRPQTENLISPILQQASMTVQSVPSAQASPSNHKDRASPAVPPSKKTKCVSTTKDQRPVKRRKAEDAKDTADVETVPSERNPTPTSKSNSQHLAQNNGNGKVGEDIARESSQILTNGNSIRTPISGQPSAAPNAGPTLWPKGHHGFKIAQALRQYLMSVSGNRSKEITVEDIRLILSGNPTYPMLCDILSSRGFVIDRSTCAKYVLETTPELQYSQAPEQASQTNGHEEPISNDTGISRGQSQPAGHVPLDQPARNVPPGHFAANTSKSYHQPHMTRIGDRPPPPPGYSLALDPNSSRIYGHPAPIAPMVEAAPKPKTKGIVSDNGKMAKSKAPTKAELARKQSFGDIIDLTAASDDEELEIARAKAQQEAEELANATANEKQQVQDRMVGNIVPNSVARILPSANEPAMSTKVVEQMKRQDALQRSAYNSQTIARDILIATGKHPSMAPLNEHLAGLRTHFRNVDFTSDLSTFKWDVVDPGGPDPNDADDEDDPAQPHTNSPQAPPPVAGPGGIVETSAVTAPVPRRGRKPKIMVGDQHVRQRPVPESGQRSFSNNGRAGSLSRVGADESTGTGTAPATNTQNSMQDLSRLDAGVAEGEGALSFASAVGTNLGQSNTPSVRRGRPPGSSRKKKNEQGEVEVAIRPSLGANRASPLPTPRGSSLRNEVTPSSPSIAVMVPSPSADPSLYKPQSQRSRPRKSSPSSRQQSTPKYAVYHCHWRNCPAKLHNLDTLKRHALKHSNEYKPGPFPCLWEGCSIRSNEESSGDATFGDLHLWEQHMNSKHFSIVANKLGDGPRATPSSDNSDHYLSDSHGRRVTPLATPQRGLPDPLSLSAEPKTTKAYHAAHENDTEEERASAIYQAHLGRRRTVGPGVLRTGASYVNEKKREMLEMNEDDGQLRDPGPVDNW